MDKIDIKRSRAVSIRVKNLKQIETYCSGNISPRRYYLHNALGGEGWRIFRKDGYWNLEINNEKDITSHITWLALTDGI